MYSRINFVDHIEDIDTGEVIQEGTPLSANVMNILDEGINEESTINIKQNEEITRLNVAVSILQNTGINNAFFEGFDTLDDVNLIKGIYDKNKKVIYI